MTITTLSRTQAIVVNPASGSVSVVNAGPQGPEGVGATTLEPRVDDLETADSAQDALITALTSGKLDKSGGTMTGELILPGSPGFNLGTTNVTETVESSVKHFTIDGVFHNFHPVVFKSLIGRSVHNGTISGDASGGVTNGIPRITLAKPGTKTIKWVQEAPAGWDNVINNFAWDKEAAGSGNVHWRMWAQVLNFLSAPDFDNGTMTQVWDSNVAVPGTVGQGVYTITTGNFATPPQVFGIPPVISMALQRIDDGGDTYSGAVSVGFQSLSFV
jgi:hypothetical protein